MIRRAAGRDAADELRDLGAAVVGVDDLAVPAVAGALNGPIAHRNHEWLAVAGLVAFENGTGVGTLRADESQRFDGRNLQ